MIDPTPMPSPSEAEKLLLEWATFFRYRTLLAIKSQTPDSAIEYSRAEAYCHALRADIGRFSRPYLDQDDPLDELIHPLDRPKPKRKRKK